MAGYAGAAGLGLQLKSRSAPEPTGHPERSEGPHKIRDRKFLVPVGAILAKIAWVALARTTMKKKSIIAVVLFHVVTFNTKATIVINFDTDAFGNSINAPSLFFDTVRLSELYAPLGVHFSGPDSNDGGAILDQAGAFGVDAHSGRNFLAFNRLSVMGDFGIPRDPETITFDTLASNISIFAAGGTTAKTFLMQGFDANGSLVAFDTLTTLDWAELQIASPLGIRSVRLLVTNPIEEAFGFVFDDLSVDFVPEPSTISFLICAAAVGFVTQLCRRRN